MSLRLGIKPPLFYRGPHIFWFQLVIEKQKHTVNIDIHSNAVIGVEFVVPFSSCSLDLKLSTSLSKTICHISLKRWYFHPIPIFERKKVSFDDFFMMTWEQENKSKEHQIPCHSEHLLVVIHFQNTNLPIYFTNKILVSEQVTVGKTWTDTKFDY